jgi:hypothetical protein
MSDTLASLSAGNRSLILKLSTPTDWNNTKPRNDLSAIKVWCSTTAGFTPGDTSLVFSGPVSSSITIPNLSDNTTYYVKYAFISSIDATVFTYSKQYTQTTLTSTSGTNGASTYRIYIAAANSSATPTTPSTTQSGATPTGWSTTPVTLTGTQAQFQSDGVTPAGSTTTTWSTPYLSYFKVDTLEAITTNTGSLTVTGTFKAGTATLDTTNNTINTGTAGGILYSGGNFAFGNSTTNISFNGTALSLNGNIVGRTNIIDGSISTTKFASGLEPVTIVTTVPTTKSTNSIFNSTDGKLYRWNGTSYVASVPAADVTGQLSNAQIADIAAAKLTGQIISTQISDSAISTPKLAAGAITAAKIAADTITANEIAANAITASEIAAGAVIAGKIAANAVTANEIAANTITAGQIAAGTITATQIAAGTITAGQIATGTITATQIATGSITADRIDSRGLSIKDTSGNIIVSAGTSLATSTFAGNVTGSLNGTAASTITSNITAAQNTADAKLAKVGSDTLTGPISLNAASAITVGTPALDSVTGHNGFYIGSTGIVGTKNGVATFTLDNSGNAIFAGSLSAATGTFAGSLSAATGTFAGSLSAATGSFGGNVTGSVGGTAATTLINNITTANNTATNANNTATAAQDAAALKLAKTGADTLTGPITLGASNSILVGTVNDGVYIGSTGIVGRKASQTTFAVDASGNAIFKGDLTGASGTFTGNLTVGSSPAISGTTMTGSGGIINSGGTFALGNSTTNIAFNGSTLTLNGNIVGTSNIKTNAVTAVSSTATTRTSTYFANNSSAYPTSLQIGYIHSWTGQGYKPLLEIHSQIYFGMFTNTSIANASTVPYGVSLYLTAYVFDTNANNAVIETIYLAFPAYQLLGRFSGQMVGSGNYTRTYQCTNSSFLTAGKPYTMYLFLDYLYFYTQSGDFINTLVGYQSASGLGNNNNAGYIESQAYVSSLELKA